MSAATPTPDLGQKADPKRAEDLLPLVYEQLRKLAAHKLAHELTGQTLQPTSLVHEAWLRLAEKDQTWANRRHFIAAAAEAMRRILIERARRRKVLERGGFATPTEYTESEGAVSALADKVLAVHEALDSLATEDALAADLVKLRYFMGMSMPEAAESLGLPLRSAERLWTFARAWLRHAIEG